VQNSFRAFYMFKTTEPSSLAQRIQDKTLADDVFSVGHGEGTLYAVYFTVGKQRWKQPVKMEQIGAEMEREWGVEFEYLNGDNKMLWFGGVDEKEGRSENECYQAMFNVDQSGYSTIGRDHALQSRVEWLTSDQSTGRMAAVETMKRRQADEEAEKARPVAKRARVEQVVGASGVDEDLGLKLSLVRNRVANVELQKRNSELVARGALLQARVSDLELEKLGFDEILGSKERDIAALKEENEKCVDAERTQNALRTEICALQGELLGWRKPGKEDAEALEAAITMRMAGGSAQVVREDKERLKKEVTRLKVERNVAADLRMNLGLELVRVKNEMFEMEMFKDEQIFILGDQLREATRETEAMQAKVVANDKVLKDAQMVIIQLKSHVGIESFADSGVPNFAITQLAAELERTQKGLQAVKEEFEEEKKKVWDLVQRLKRAQMENCLATKIMCIGGLMDQYYEFFAREDVGDKKIADNIRRLGAQMDGLNQIEKFDTIVQSAEGALAALGARFEKQMVELKDLRTELAVEKREGERMMEFLKTIGEQVKMEENAKKQSGERRKADVAMGECGVYVYYDSQLTPTHSQRHQAADEQGAHGRADAPGERAQKEGCRAGEGREEQGQGNQKVDGAGEEREGSRGIR
jgi:hypothetical protein